MYNGLNCCVMLALRLPITLILVGAYTLGYAAWGDLPRILCRGADGHTRLEMPGSSCCKAEHALANARDSSDDDLPADSSCGACTDSAIPAAPQHSAPWHQGKPQPVEAAFAVACVACSPADVSRASGACPAVVPGSSAGGDCIVLRC